MSDGHRILKQVQYERGGMVYIFWQVIRMNIEYHKGYPCVFKAILCQEGYCSDCAIYLEETQDWVNEETSIKNIVEEKWSKSIAYSRELTMAK